MKRLFFLTAILAVLGLSSCEKDPSQAILGTWEAVSIEANVSGVNMTIDMAEMGYDMEFTFKANGTGTAYVEYEGENTTESFDYEISGNNLRMTMNGETEITPFGIEGKKMTMDFSGEVIGQGDIKIKVHFQKK